jgi:uncharacterized protein YggE
MKISFLAALLFPLAAFAEGGGLPTQPYIYVEGRAEAEKPADIVTLSFDLGEMNASQAVANKAVQAKANKVFKLLASTGIDEKDVIASDLRSQSVYEEATSTTRTRGKLLGYYVSRPFVVKVRDLTKFAKLGDDLLALGVAEFERIEEGLTDKKELEEQAWDKAVANARERAEKTLKTTGMKISSIFAISPVAFPQISRNIFGDSYGQGMESVASGPADKGSDPSHYRLAPISISQSVHIIFLIIP